MRGSRHQPFGDDDLLLVAARQRARRHVGAVGLDREQADHLVDQPAARRARSMMPPVRQRGRARRRRGCRAPTSAASALRSCGPRGSAPCRCASPSPRAGWRWRRGLPSIRISPVDAAQHAEQRQQQFALALAVEAAEADDLARARRVSEMSCSRSVQDRLRTSSTGGASLAARAGLGGKTWLYSRPIISSTTSLSVFVPAA